MSLRSKLILLFTVTIALCVAAVTWTATLRMRRAFEAADEQHTSALIGQFRQQFAARGQQVGAALDRIAAREDVQRLALESAKAQPDFAPYVQEAGALASAHQLDFLELIAQDGTIISSAQWPARFGYKEEWVPQAASTGVRNAFLKREELPDAPVLGLVAVRAARLADGVVYVVGGVQLDRSFLRSLTLPTGMRALLYTNVAPGFSPQAVEDASGAVENTGQLAPLIQKVQLQGREMSQVVNWLGSPQESETVQAIPLEGREKELLGVLLVASSRRDLVELEMRVRSIAIAVGLAGVFGGTLLAVWAAARVTKPIEQLAEAASEVAQGNWSAQVAVSGGAEVERLAEAFNRMTRELVEQRDRLLQAERVAAWRELARRLAHELKNPLFPLQITIENLLRAREVSPEQFDEVFHESTTTLLAELSNLKAIIGRFSDFAKMPTPQLQSVKVNDAVQRALKIYEAQLEAQGRPNIAAKLELRSDVPEVPADPELLHRALSNLILNAMDAMPNGGTLTLRTHRHDDAVRIEIGDTGTGLTKEECDRLFTPYYTTKQHGTGLGLAIVQSVVADHHGKISVESEPDKGTTFRIDLPVKASVDSDNARGASVE